MNNINSTLHIKFTTPHEEFCNFIIKTIKNGNIYIDKVFIEAVNYYLFRLLENISFFMNYKYVSSNKFYPYYDLEPITLDDYISRGYCCLSFYKIQFDGVKDTGISDIKIEFPDYLFGRLDFQEKTFFKKKMLKTKEIFNLEFREICLKKDSLIYIKNNLPDTFFISHSIKNSPLKAYTDHYICITKEESLPFPIILYPQHSIIGFKPDLDSKDIYFCSCFKQAIINYIQMRLIKGTSIDEGIISHNDFPKEFVDRLSDKNYVVEDSIIEYFTFKENICHECNKKIPRGYYNGHSSKIHKIGWYVEKRCLTYGINIYGDVILGNKCPEHIKKINEIKIYSDGKDIDLVIRMERIQILEKRRTAICNEIENEVRSEFGFSKIGESWVTETTLYYEIKEAFPDTEVIHHGKPEWLGLQHLDIWLPEMKIAIEYQGEQHNKPVSMFGGENGYKKIMELDKRKNDLCKNNGIRLIYVDGKYNINDVLNTIRDIISTNKKA